MKNVIIIGAGGHGKVIADAVLAAGDNLLGFLDDHHRAETRCGFPILGTTKDYVNFPEAEFVLGFGEANLRETMARTMTGVKWHTVIHPSAIISKLGVTIGEGTVILAGAIVNPGTTIGRHCILNTAAVVEHDNRIGDFAHISVGAKLAGVVTIGKSTWVGVGAVVRNATTICDGCMIGAGAVVVKSIEERGTYVGVPARRMA